VRHEPVKKVSLPPVSVDWMTSIPASLADTVVSTTLDGTVVTWNEGGFRVFGYEAAEMVGRPLALVVPEDRREVLALAWVEVARGVPVQHHETVWLHAHDDVAMEVALTISPICDAAGAPHGACVIARDITDLRWMAATLDATLGSLEAALAEARESEARSRRFLADAAHQLRTPVAGIRASAEVLLRGSLPPEEESLLLNVVGETARVGRLMTALLRMARLDGGEGLTQRPCDVVALCREEADRAHCLAPELDLVVAAEVAGPMPELDAPAMREIISNLLDNARRHAVGRIELALERVEDMVIVRLFDDGAGMDEATAERAFERFVSLDGRGGSGLGLPIARGLARAHGGELTFEGGAFVLRLPMRAEPVGCGGTLLEPLDDA